MDNRYGNYSEEENKVMDDMRRNRKSSVVILIIIIVAYVIYAFGFQNNPDCQGTTTGRTPLSTDKCNLTEFIQGTGSEYTEDDKSSTLANQMADFYSASGVQPVVYDKTGDASMSQAELQAFADEYYESALFETTGVKYDEGHMLIVFQAEGDTLKVAYHVGTDAQTVMDEEAMDTFNSNLESNFKNTSKKGIDKLVATFKDSSSSIMGRSVASTYLIIGAVAVLVIYGGFATWRNLQKSKKENGGTN